MNKSTNSIFLLIYLVLINVSIAQVSEEVENGINTSLEAKYGGVKNISRVIDVNKEINEYQQSILPITDPYGTLSDCYLFVENVSDGGLVGVYKNNSLLWDSGPIVDLFNSNDHIQIYGSVDLNNDNTVEIMAVWNYGVSGFSQNIWIFSWDGIEGKVINDTISGRTPSTNKSVIWSYSYVTEILDVNGDGVMEIKGVNKRSTDKTKIYSWNGEKYGDFGLTMPDYVPMNLLTAKVKCKVSKSQYGLLYNYTVINDSSSSQSIWRVLIDRPYEKLFINSTSPNKKWVIRGTKNVATWDVDETIFGFPFDFINPGESKINFKLETESPLVYIGNYYLQGKNGKKIYTKKYIKVNSFKGKTICGKNPQNVFVPFEFIDTLITYTDSSYALVWIKDEQTRDKYDNYFNNAKNYLNQNNNNAAKSELQKVLTDCNADSSSVLTSEAYALLYFNTDYLIKQIPEGEPGLPVKLEDSQGSLLQGGSLQYYDGGWKDAIDNGDGTFTVQTEKDKVSLKIHYAGATQKVDNVTVGSTPYVFQTVNTEVQLKDSQGNFLPGGMVKYYASGWKDFGEAANGTAAKELLPREYTFRMEYGGANQDKKQNIDSNNVVVFQTVNAEVQLKDSQGNLLPGGTVKYYASGWKDFGEAANGSATKELLPREYTFRMEYAGANQDKKQNIDSNNVVVFQTVNAEVQLKDSQGNLLSGGTVKYYASGWKDFGEAANGTAAKELLPREYTFRMEYGGANQDKKQNIDSNNVVVFQTINAKVQLKDSQSNLLPGGTVKYYASGWKDFGEAANGSVTKELLPREYTFRMEYGGVNQDKKQNIDSNNVVVFQTINAEVQLKDSQGNLLPGGTVKYYASGWKDFGQAVNGSVTKELLPREYTFRMEYEGISNDKGQNISANGILVFTTVLATVKVKDANNQPVDGATVEYYGSGWKTIGTTVNGEVTKELLPKEITFKAMHNSKQAQKQQDITTNSIVEITIE